MKETYRIISSHLLPELAAFLFHVDETKATRTAPALKAMMDKPPRVGERWATLGGAAFRDEIKSWTATEFDRVARLAKKMKKEEPETAALMDALLSACEKREAKATERALMACLCASRGAEVYIMPIRASLAWCYTVKALGDNAKMIFGEGFNLDKFCGAMSGIHPTLRNYLVTGPKHSKIYDIEDGHAKAVLFEVLHKVNRTGKRIQELAARFDELGLPRPELPKAVFEPVSSILADIPFPEWHKKEQVQSEFEAFEAGDFSVFADFDLDYTSKYDFLPERAKKAAENASETTKAAIRNALGMRYYYLNTGNNGRYSGEYKEAKSRLRCILRNERRREWRRLHPEQLALDFAPKAAHDVEAVEAVKVEKTVLLLPPVTPEKLEGKAEVLDFVKTKKAFRAACEAHALGILSNINALADYAKRAFFVTNGYSPRNAFLLSLQNPTCVMVRPFRWWRDHGCMVKKGEKALHIYGPNFAKIEKPENEEVGELGKKILELEEEQGGILTGFSLRPVFDLSQVDTTNAHDIEIPSFGYGVEDADGLAEAAWGIIQRWETRLVIGCTHAAGMTDGEKIYIDPHSTPAAAVHTWAHESAHIAFKHIGAAKERGVKEAEAEVAAVLACGALGIDAAEHAAQYVKNWGGLGLASNCEFLGRCEKVAREVVEHFNHLKALDAAQAERPMVAPPPPVVPVPAAEVRAAPKAEKPSENLAAALFAGKDAKAIKREAVRLKRAGKIEEARRLLDGALKAGLITKGSYAFQMANLEA